ncbi:FISUMP domain-containing protein [Fibrobacter sp.]|uniref:FISUMP domain-containing protein n=1 Tax=Fibrobacter sp. TaxID=35828 RepID=UPI00388EE583
MNKKYLLALAACTLMFAACGDDVTEVTNIQQSGMAVLESGEKLLKQKCDTTNAGEMLFVMDSSEAFICDGESWQTLKGADGKDGEDGEKGSKGDSGEDGNNGTSCTATKNTDGSFDLVCGGEKVGTITNGADGKDGADGRDGKDGTNGKDGVNGNDGTSCTATVNEDGNFDLVCGGKKVGTIKNGADGKDGKDGTNGNDGSSCTATKNTDGNFDLVCGGEKVGTITNGKDGQDGTNGNDGTSCTAEPVTADDGRKGVKVTCGDDEVGTIWDGTNGSNGTSCTATENTDGSFDLVCGGEKVGTITNGKDGLNGNNGTDGTNCTAQSVTNAAGLEGLEVTCGETVVDTIWNGKDGEKGDPGTNGDNGNDGVGCSLEDDGEGTVSVTCGEGEGATTTTIFKAVCGTKPYDPAKSFCSEGTLYSCDDKPYDPLKSFCSEGELFSCNDKPFDPKKQYCLKVTRDEIDIYSVEDLLTDPRDNQVYKTVEICNNDKTSCQTWMAENLNYSVNPDEQSWCGGCENGTTNEGDCSVYGRLYTWAAAVGKSEDECGDRKTCNLPSGDIRGVCPEGWHLPSNVEWNALFTAVGGTDVAGKKLKADSDLWNYHEGISNDDSFGFSVLPAGYRSCYGSFHDEGDGADFWSSTEYDSLNADDWYFSYDDRVYDDGFSKLNGFSVRCLRD